MFKRLKILTLLQLGNKIKVKNITNKKQFALNILLYTLLFIGITALLNFVIGFIKNTIYLPINKGMLTFILFVTQLIGVVVATGSLMHSLYKSKDNAILLSYPARPNEIFISKLIVAYLKELKRSVFFLLPLLIAYGMVSGGNIVFYLVSIFFFFILPLFPVLIGALLSIPLIYIKKLFDKVPVIYLVLILGVILLIFLGLQTFVETIPRPLRIVAIYYKFVNNITAFIMSANRFALYNIFVSDMLYSMNFFLSFLWILLILAGLILLVYYISMPIYFKLVSKAGENASNKVKTTKNANKKPTFLAFLKKEVLLTLRNIDQVINNYVLILIMPILLYAMNVVFSAIITSQLGDSLIIAFNIIVAGILVLSSNTQSASAVTVEGNEIVLLKTAPSNTSNMIWAKMFINVIVSTILISVSCSILSISALLDGKTIFGIALVLILLNWGHILWSFQLDIVSPKLREYAETGRIDNNANVNFSMTLGLIISLLMGFVTAFLMSDNYLTAWTKIILIAFAFFILRLYIFIKNLKVYFKRIEY